MAFIFNRISRANENPNPDSRLEDGITNYLSLDFNNVYAYQITYISTAINKFDARIDRYDIDYVNETLVYKDSVYASNYIDNSIAVAVDPAQSLLAVQLRGQQINTSTQRNISQDGFIWRDSATEIFAKNDCGCEDSENGGNLPPAEAVKWNDILFRPQCLVNPDLCSLPMWSITQADIDLWNSAWSRNGNSITNTDFFGTTNNEDIRIRRNNTPIAIVQGTGFNPAADNTFSLGTNALRWSNVFGVIGTFNSIALPTFTQGSVLFAGAGGVISEDFAGIAFDAATNRLALNRAYIANTTFGLNGQGATSATWTAQFHNSTGTSDTLLLRDDGAIYAGQSSALYHSGGIGSFEFRAAQTTRNAIGTTTGNLTQIFYSNNTNGNTEVWWTRGTTLNNGFGWRYLGSLTPVRFRLDGGAGVANIVDYFQNGRQIHTATATATTNNDFGWNFTGTLTARNTASDTLNGVLLNPTLVAAANNQVLVGATISPIFSNGSNPGTINSIRGVDVLINTVSGVTRAIGYGSNISIGSGSNVGIISHFFASSFGSVLGTANTQIGFNATSNLIGAAINYGFYGEIPDGTNRWNIFILGTAPNYLAGNLSVGTTAATARVHIRGSSAVTGNALLVENSTPNTLISVANTGIVSLGGASGRSIRPFSDTDVDTPNLASGGGGIAFKSSYTTQSGWSFHFTNNAATRSVTSNPAAGFNANVVLLDNLSMSSGVGVYNQLTLLGTINQTGTANGITRGIFISPTLTSAARYIALDVRDGHVAFPNQSRTTSLDLTVAFPSSQRYHYDFDATAGNLSLTLPTIVAALVGIVISIKKIDSSVNTVSLVASGGQLIDGLGTQAIATQYDGLKAIAMVTGGGTFYWSIIS